MLIIEDQAHLDDVKAFAAQAGPEALQALQSCLNYLDGYADYPEEGRTTRCHLFKDFAPHSFFFRMDLSDNGGEFQQWFVGGAIYSGPGQRLDGGAPAFTCSLDMFNPEKANKHNWSTHT